MKVVALVLASLAGLAGCGREKTETLSTAPPPPKAQNVLEEIASPAGAGAAEPFLFARGDRVLLSWLEPVAGTDRVALRFADYGAGKWTPARTIVERNDLFVNWADFPSVVEDPNGVLFAHWLQKSGTETYAYDVRMSTSKDDGATWREPFLLNRDGRKAEHGFVALVPLAGGGVGATWLDGRKMKSASGADHEHDAGDMTIRYATVDAAGSVTNDVELDPRTCECCTTGMTMTPSGPVIVYRDRSPEEIRDISFVRHVSGAWTKPKTLHADNWNTDGCPVNGPQIDAVGTSVAAAWFTGAGDKGRVFVAFSSDGGASFGAPVKIDEGKPIGRVDVILLGAETALVTWLEQTATGGEIRARLVRRSGEAEPSIKIADSSTARAAGFPRISRVGSDVYFAWTEQDVKSKRIHVVRRPFSDGASSSGR